MAPAPRASCSDLEASAASAAGARLTTSRTSSTTVVTELFY